MSTEPFEIITCPTEEAWLKERDNGLGASESAIALGASRFQSKFGLWSEKAGIVDPGASDSEAMEWGKLLEDPIARKYAEMSGRQLIDRGRWTILRSKKHPFLFCTLDREISPFDDRGPGVLEIKTASAYKEAEWAVEPPLEYQIQVQHQLAVTGYQHAAIAVLIGGQKFGWLDIERNEAAIDMIVNRCGEFWESVQKNNPPPPDGSKDATEAIRAMFKREDSQKIVTLPREAAQWDAELLDIGEQLAKLEQRERELKNNLMLAIGEAAAGTLPSGVCWTFKTVNRKAHEVKASSSRQLRRVGVKP